MAHTYVWNAFSPVRRRWLCRIETCWPNECIAASTMGQRRTFRLDGTSVVVLFFWLRNLSARVASNIARLPVLLSARGFIPLTQCLVKEAA